MEFKEIGGFLPENVIEAFGACGIVDLNKPANLSTDGKIVDYSFATSKPDRETCLSGGYESMLLNILRKPSRKWSPPAEWMLGVKGDITTRTPHPRSGSRNEGEVQRESKPGLAEEYRFRVDHNTAEYTIAVRAYSRKQKGKLAGNVGVLRSYGVDDCQAQVRSLIGRLKGRLPDKAERRVPMVVMSTVDAEHRGRGLGVLLYKVALQAWFDAYGPSLVAPNMCSSGRSATSTAAMRVWSSLCRELPCEYPVVAVVEPVPGLDGVDVKTVKKHKCLD
jgi:GNAT superfamily N-acetyltransferase